MLANPTHDLAAVRLGFVEHVHDVSKIRCRVQIAEVEIDPPLGVRLMGESNVRLDPFAVRRVGIQRRRIVQERGSRGALFLPDVAKLILTIRGVGGVELLLRCRGDFGAHLLFVVRRIPCIGVELREKRGRGLSVTRL